MKIISPSFEILTPLDGQAVLKHIELCGRVCYKSEDKITGTSAATFVANIIKRGHEAVLEHFNITVKFICDRGVSHELVRHRLASYCQESTRYCNYSKDGFGGEITVIWPCFLAKGSTAMQHWVWACTQAALKMARKLRGENPTPMTHAQAAEHLHEELGDVRLCLKVLDVAMGGDNTTAVEAEKLQRWLDRLTPEREKPE